MSRINGSGTYVVFGLSYLLLTSLFAVTEQELRIKAQMGSTISQNDLAKCYYNGSSQYRIKKNLDQAFIWFEIAADGGDAEAKYNLGVCYEKGHGTTENPVLAYRSYYQAALQNFKDAQYELGECYYAGYGTNKNFEEAFKWYTKAAQQGSVDGQYRVGFCYFNGNGVERDQKLGISWYKKAAQRGHTDSQYLLGNCYFNGTSIEKDINQARQFYKKAAEQGHEQAEKMLEKFKKTSADTCSKNEFNCKKASKEQINNWFQKKDKQSIECLQNVAESGDPYAQVKIGQCYQYGIGTKKDFVQAFYWYKQAALQGNSDAQNNLGNCYFYGIGVEKDLQKAKEWYEKAAKKYHPKAKTSLGKITKLQNPSTEFKNIPIQSEDCWIRTMIGFITKDEYSNPIYPELKKEIENYLNRGLPIHEKVYRAGRDDPGSLLQNAPKTLKGYMNTLKHSKYDEEEVLSILVKFFVDGEIEPTVDEFQQIEDYEASSSSKLSWIDNQLHQMDFLLQNPLIGALRKTIQLCIDSGLSIPEHVYRQNRQDPISIFHGKQQTVENYIQKLQRLNYEDTEALSILIKFFVEVSSELIIENIENIETIYQKLLENDLNAFTQLQKAASEKHPAAQFYMGLVYFEGKCVQKDIDLAIRYFQQASEQKNADASV